jgi:hypothetical protein
MKTNTKVFNVIVILLIGIVCYYSSGNFKLLYRCIKGGNFQKLTQTAIKNERPTAPKMASEAKKAEIDNQKVLAGQPNYTSKLDVQKGKQGESLLISRGTDTHSATPVTQKVILPSPPKTPEEDISMRVDYFQDFALARHHTRMLKIGGSEEYKDPNGYQVLAKAAYSQYALELNKINAWQNELEGRFRILQDLEIFSPSEKEYIKTRLINKAGNPIPLNSTEEMQEVMNKLNDIERQQRWSD